MIGYDPIQWISKTPPEYVWSNDSWYNEKDGNIYTPNIQSMCWEHQEVKFPFTKKTKMMKLPKEKHA